MTKFETSEFYVQYPAYFALFKEGMEIDPQTGNASFPGGMRFLIGTADEGNFLPLFTDGPLAEDYVKGTGLGENLVILTIENSHAFREILRLQSPQVTHVIFDPPTEGKVCGRILPIEEAKRQLNDPGSSVS